MRCGCNRFFAPRLKKLFWWALKEISINEDLRSETGHHKPDLEYDATSGYVTLI